MKKKLNVLQVLPSLVSGGVERGVLEINKALIKAGHKSFVASQGGRMEYSVQHDGGVHIKLPLKSKNIYTVWRNIKRLSEVIRKYEIDIVHARSRAPAWSAYFACQETKCKFVTTVHGNYSVGKGIYKKLKTLYNSSMVMGDRIITVSNYIKRYALENYDVFRLKAKQRKTTVIHRGVDIENFDPDRVTPQRIVDLQQKLNLPDGKMVILLPGRLTGWKGQMYLVDVLKNLQNKNYFCLMVGDDKSKGNYKQRLKQKIIDNGLEGSVRIEKFISDMAAGYMLADIVVSASVKGEAFGRIAIEAQAMKRNIVATAVGGSLETIINNKTGWLVPHNNPEEFAKVLDKVLSMSKTQRVRIGNAARKHVVENFSKKIMCKKIIRVYEKLR